MARKKLYLYLISQKENNGYDTYDSAVVVAESEEEARNTLPSDWIGWPSDPWIGWRGSYSAWASSPDKVSALLVGTAAKGSEKGVVCASFNAG